MVGSLYAGYPDGLWNLPGGRQEAHELLEETVVREVFEETALQARCNEFAYMIESYDGDRHFLATIFHIDLAAGDPRPPTRGDHVIAARWVMIDEIDRLPMAAIVRDPLRAYLDRALPRRYLGRTIAGVTIDWEDEP